MIQHTKKENKRFRPQTCAVFGVAITYLILALMLVGDDSWYARPIKVSIILFSVGIILGSIAVLTKKYTEKWLVRLIISAGVVVWLSIVFVGLQLLTLPPDSFRF